MFVLGVMCVGLLKVGGGYHPLRTPAALRRLREPLFPNLVTKLSNSVLLLELRDRLREVDADTPIVHKHLMILGEKRTRFGSRTDRKRTLFIFQKAVSQSSSCSNSIKPYCKLSPVYKRDGEMSI